MASETVINVVTLFLMEYFAIFFSISARLYTCNGRFGCWFYNVRLSLIFAFTRMLIICFL